MAASLSRVRKAGGRAFQFQNWPSTSPQKPPSPKGQFCNLKARPQTRRSAGVRSKPKGSPKFLNLGGAQRKRGHIPEWHREQHSSARDSRSESDPAGESQIHQFKPVALSRPKHDLVPLFRGGAVDSNLHYGLFAAPKQCSGRVTHLQRHCLTTEYSRETVPRPKFLWRSDRCHPASSAQSRKHRRPRTGQQKQPEEWPQISQSTEQTEGVAQVFKPGGSAAK